MKVEADVINKVQVTIKTAKRNKEGKVEYEVYETINVVEAEPQEVKEALLRGIAASKK